MEEMSGKKGRGGVAFDKVAESLKLVAESFWEGVKLGWKQGLIQNKFVNRATRMVAIRDHILKNFSCTTRKIVKFKNENYIKYN